MSFDVIVRVLHIILAAIWLGAAFFLAWFLLPAVGDAGPDGGKVMMGVQQRGWTWIIPVIAVLTVVTGIRLYWPFMSNPGPTGRVLGIGGAVGVLALLVGGGLVGRTMAKAEALSGQAARASDGNARAAMMKQIGELRQRALTYTRLLSVLTIVAAILMSLAGHI